MGRGDSHPVVGKRRDIHQHSWKSTTVVYSKACSVNVHKVLIGWKWQPISSFNIIYLGWPFQLIFFWSKHIRTSFSKARQLVGLLFRQFYKHASTDTIHKLYLTIVQPHPENLRPLLGYRFWDDWEHSKVCKQGVLKAVVQRHQVSGHAW